jgi:hypothetical protein
MSDGVSDEEDSPGEPAASVDEGTIQFWSDEEQRLHQPARYPDCACR